MSSFAPYLFLYVIIGGVILVACRRKSQSWLPLPPGPKKLPIIGNLFDIPSTFQWETYMEWSRQYDSDILHLQIGGISTIILSSVQAANDLLEKRSSIYSDRPQAQSIMTELIGCDFLIGFMRYGDSWRLHRRLFHNEFHASAARKFQPRERRAAHELLRRLLSTPDDFMDHIRHMAGDVIMGITYGISVLPLEDPYVTLAEQGMQEISNAAVFGKYLVDWIPLLRHVPAWFPGATFKRRVIAGHAITQAMLNKPFAEAKRNVVAGTDPDCFVSSALRNLEESDPSPEHRAFREHVVKQTAGTMYTVGADTTVSALQTFVLGMLANPEAQRAAQRQIDAVCVGDVGGERRLPDFSDEDALPWVSAIMKEVLRWKNVTPIAIPHFLPVEDEYRGYRIPAGSIIIPNVWAMLHDEDTYPDPYNFKPERFLLDGKLNLSVKSPEAAFGFGRRVCPGRHMASSSLWITIASILATFDITKAVDENGKIIEPSYDFVSGMVCVPAPFKCSIKPRSLAAVELIPN